MGLDTARLPLGTMECHYNGVVWGPSADTTMFSVKPNLDPAGRTVMSATYTITIVTAGGCGTRGAGSATST